LLQVEVQEARQQLARQLVELDEAFRPPPDYTVSSPSSASALNIFTIAVAFAASWNLLHCCCASLLLWCAGPCCVALLWLLPTVYCAEVDLVNVMVVGVAG
jgi:hypothetical protein